jgi:hypothetical protein
MPGSILLPKMARTKLWFATLAAFCLVPLGCSRDSADSSAAAPLPTAAKESKTASTKLAPVNDSLKSGAFDDAAAQLLALQNSGQNFTPKEAADYRQAMNDAYTRALEAAEKGDQRAIAALQMLRASKPR